MTASTRIALKSDPAAVVGEEVRAYMARRRVSQAALAIHLDISQSSVSRRLLGDQPFDVDELARMAELFGVPIQNLLGPLLDRTA